MRLAALGRGKKRERKKERKMHQNQSLERNERAFTVCVVTVNIEDIHGYYDLNV